LSGAGSLRPRTSPPQIMNEFVFFADIGGDLVKIGRDTADTFGVDMPHFISQVISFVIVAILLQRFAYKPILQVLEQRRQRIAEGLANADRIKQELAKTEAARQEVLNQANSQANRLIEEARAAAARVQEQETQKAIAAAEQIIAKAREAAAQDHARMLTDLKREIGHLVVETTARVTGKVLTPDDQQRLAQETTRQLAA
jgi:F-type H+-transporting ATPase subunit b